MIPSRAVAPAVRAVLCGRRERWERIWVVEDAMVVLRGGNATDTYLCVLFIDQR